MVSAALAVTSVAELATAAAGSVSMVTDAGNVLLPEEGSELVHSVHEKSHEDQLATEERPTMNTSLTVKTRLSVVHPTMNMSLLVKT